LGFLTGGALGLSGSVFQALLRNPLADPYIVGVSGGAALFGASALVIGLSFSGVTVASLTGALMVAFALAALLKRDRSKNADTTLLAGVIFNAFVGALLTLMKTLVPAQKSQEILFWLIGTLSYVDTSTIITLTISIALCAAALIAHCGSLETLTLGSDEAARLGLNVQKTRFLFYFGASILVALTVPFVGMIGFIGLVVPHALRRAFSHDARFLLPASFLFGGGALATADALGRLSFPLFGSEIPTGAITALFGALAFGILLLKREKQ